jgi:hypothetical protein
MYNLHFEPPPLNSTRIANGILFKLTPRSPLEKLALVQFLVGGDLGTVKMFSSSTHSAKKAATATAGEGWSVVGVEVGEIKQSPWNGVEVKLQQPLEIPSTGIAIYIHGTEPLALNKHKNVATDEKVTVFGGLGHDAPMPFARTGWSRACDWGLSGRLTFLSSYVAWTGDDDIPLNSLFPVSFKRAAIMLLWASAAHLPNDCVRQIISFCPPFHFDEGVESVLPVVAKGKGKGKRGKKRK